MNTTASASLRFDASIDEVWAAAVDDAVMTAAFQGSGPIPGIDRIENLGTPNEVGLERIIHSSDGSTARERVTVLEAPTRQCYDLFGFSGVFAWLVEVGHAEWRLEADGEATLVTWMYVFETKSPLAWPVVRLLMPFFSRAQAGCLERMAQSIRERAAVS